jgi:hypothetical protein
MAGYNGPATIVSRRGEIDVTVNLRSRTDPEGCPTWTGHLDRCDRSQLREAMNGMSVHGLIIRFPDGGEGNFMPSPETTWSTCSISIRGFMRGAGDSGAAAAIEVVAGDPAAAVQLPYPRQPTDDQRRHSPPFQSYSNTVTCDDAATCVQIRHSAAERRAEGPPLSTRTSRSKWRVWLGAPDDHRLFRSPRPSSGAGRHAEHGNEATEGCHRAAASPRKRVTTREAGR